MVINIFPRKKKDSVTVGTLWGDIRQRQTKVILGVAAIQGQELHMPPYDVLNYTNKPKEFTSRFPYAKIPALETADGLKVIEGSVIARYLCKTGTKENLLGPNTKETTLIDQWVHFIEHELVTPVDLLFGLIYGGGLPYSIECLEWFQQALVRGLKYIESHLATRTTVYVATNSMSLADLVLVGSVFHATRIALGEAERAEYPALFKHYGKVTADERFKKYWGTAEFTKARLTEPTKFGA